jgi:adenine-specific DNA-methyltransferase
MTRPTKLELTWIGKENRPRLEPRILIEDPAKSYHAPFRASETDSFDNRLIFGDNLLALKALEQEFAGKIKCIFIDPPFNTGEMFDHYDDGLEHSLWLTQMRDRLTALHRLLAGDGSFFVQIDDNELGYLIAVMDEIFGRRNRIAVVTFKQSSVSGPKAVNPGLVSTTSFVLYYAKDRAQWKPNRVFQPTERDDRYNRYVANVDEPFSVWRLEPLRKAFADFHGIAVKEIRKQFADSLESTMMEFVLTDPRRVVRTARVAPKDINPDARAALAQSDACHGRVFRSQRADRGDYYFLDGEQLVFYSAKAKHIDGKWVTALPASTMWDDLLSNNLHNEGGVDFPNGKKPEGLLKRILDLATDAGDWILDSFAGSGTTGAVAHKMGRRWIMVELGEHCHTHIIPRLTRVINGADDSGITGAVDWKGGGGFRYYRLAPSLLEKDQFGNWVINRKYDAPMLAEAICKLEGFVYAPSDTVYWQHGRSTEQDFIYITTQTLTREQIQRLSDEVGESRSLLVMCGAFRVKNLDEYPNLTVKKIPKAVLARCEWGHDDYSLEIKNLPTRQSEETEPTSDGALRSKEERRAMAGQRSLFDPPTGKGGAK